MSEQAEAQKKPEPKHSITERLKYEQEQQKQTQEQKTPKQKIQNMELYQALAVFFVKMSSVFLFPVKKEKTPGRPWLLFCILLRYNMLIITYRK